MTGFLFPFIPKLNFGRWSINIQWHRWMVWWPHQSWVPLPLTKLVRYQDDSHHESDVSVSRHHQIETTFLFVGQLRSLVTRVMFSRCVWNDKVSFSFHPETQLRSLIYKHPTAPVNGVVALWVVGPTPINQGSQVSGWLTSQVRCCSVTSSPNWNYIVICWSIEEFSDTCYDFGTHLKWQGFFFLSTRNLTSVVDL